MTLTTEHFLTPDRTLELVSVPELGRLTRRPGEPTPDLVRVPPNFPLEKLRAARATDLFDPTGKPIGAFSYVDKDTVKANAFLGVIEVDGYQVEILPKTWNATSPVEEGRKALGLMVDSFLERQGLSDHASAKNHMVTKLSVRQGPLTERIMGLFVDSVEKLVESGIRFGYTQVAEQRRFLRGRLDVARQVRQRPGNAHLFHIRHNVFQPDRPENRLLKAGVLRVARRSRDARLRLRAHNLQELFWDVPASRHIRGDFSSWDRGRLLTHYREVELTARLLLLPVVGNHPDDVDGDAWLWQSDRLFENHLAHHLDRMLRSRNEVLRLVTQVSTFSLGRDAAGQRHFGLRPDLAVRTDSGYVGVLDTKWRLVGGRKKGPRIKSGEAYQMYAYGRKVLKGSGPLVLIYPAWRHFQTPIGPYTLEIATDQDVEGLQLIGVPFDLLTGRFLTDGLPAGVLGMLAPILGMDVGI